jgi:hypothetical protein
MQTRKHVVYKQKRVDGNPLIALQQYGQSV